MAVTTEQLIELSAVCNTLREQLFQAKGRLVVIEEQLNNKLEELGRLGTTPANAEEKLASLELEIASLYEEAVALVEEIQDGLNG